MTDTKNKSLPFGRISLVVFDFDGVFTDNMVYVFDDGREAVRCNRSDGMGISKLKELGIDMIILSTEENHVVAARARKLKLPCVHGVSNKLKELKKIISDRGLDFSQVAFVGNDINDKECLEAVGFPIVVADAHEDVLSLGRYITKASGGKGAVREICDIIYADINNEFGEINTRNNN